jgi:hypothetical protein
MDQLSLSRRFHLGAQKTDESVERVALNTGIAPHILHQLFSHDYAAACPQQQFKDGMLGPSQMDVSQSASDIPRSGVEREVADS